MESRLAWAFLTRAGSETDLVDELGSTAEILAEGVVGVWEPRRGPLGPALDPAFARQAMRRPVRTTVDRVGPALAQLLGRPRNRDWTWTLQVVAPDSGDPKDPRRPSAARVERALAESEWVPKSLADRRVDAEGERLLQVWVVEPDDLFLGLTLASEALTSSPGGRSKRKRPEDAVSRSGLKLEEAIDWCGAGPERGDIVADLGAAPGGWSQVALSRGATVIAVDLARMKVEAPPKRFAHLEENAFRYAPPETLDWVLCDMAYRPLEVAKLLAKWGRRSWARQLLGNVKLPMKQKAKVLASVLDILREAGWSGLRARQLYHDRDEVTIFGWLSPTQAQRAAQEPFRFRGRSRGRGRARGRGRPRATGRPKPRKRSGPRRR